MLYKFELKCFFKNETRNVAEFNTFKIHIDNLKYLNVKDKVIPETNLRYIDLNFLV